MKEYNIFLKNQPHGNLIIYMLPYWSGISPTELQLLINSALNGTLKRDFERFRNAVRVDAGGVSTKNLATRTNVEILTRDGIEIVAVKRVDNVELYYRQTLGKGDNKIEIVPSISFSKRISEQISDSVELDSKVTDTVLRIFESYPDSLAMEAQLDDIIYRIYFLIDNGIKLDANVSVSSKRKRWISEVADLPMAEIGAMSLQEFFYVALE